jgi:hypothetical protein
MMLYLPYPQRRDDLIRAAKKHHYTRRCPGVWSHAFAITNKGDKIKAAIIIGPAPYPTVARAFCRRDEDIPRHAWVSRMFSAGTSSAELDKLIQFSHKQLLALGYYWVHTLSNPFAYSITSHLRLQSRGFTGGIYHRNDYLYLGWAGRKTSIGYIVDGQPYHIRQGSTTLSNSNVHDYFPDASHIRPIEGHPKQRWAKILANTSQEYQQRLLLMTYHPQVYEPQRQPRLLIEILQCLLTPYLSLMSNG